MIQTSKNKLAIFHVYELKENFAAGLFVLVHLFMCSREMSPKNSLSFSQLTVGIGRGSFPETPKKGEQLEEKVRIQVQNGAAAGI